MLALQRLVEALGNEAGLYEQMKSVPEKVAPNLRNEMYLASEALRLMKNSGDPKLARADWVILDNYRKHVDVATKFIPTWVKVAVAMALGLGTMVGWKRIVVTVGEKIGKQHLTYAQGAAAEITAMATIWAADHLGLPVASGLGSHATFLRGSGCVAVLVVPANDVNTGRRSLDSLSPAGTDELDSLRG
jgi:PiT family inorganic phosphate transporter